MIISSSRRFVIAAENINFIEDNIRLLSPVCIMHDKLMTRTIFDVSGKSTSWLRVRTGDVDCMCNPITTASLIDKTTLDGKSISDKKSIDLQLTDYYNAITFFKSMGLKVESEQETKRTKYVCHYDGIKYTICFDVWPKLEKYIFISITPATNADEEDLDGFVETTGIRNYELGTFPTDIDKAYELETGKIARAYDILRFE